MVKQAGSDREKRVEWDDHLKHRASFIFSCVSITCIKLQGSILSPLLFPVAERKRGSTPKMKNYQNTIPKFRGLYKRVRGMLKGRGTFAVSFLPVKQKNSRHPRQETSTEISNLTKVMKIREDGSGLLP